MCFRCGVLSHNGLGNTRPSTITYKAELKQTSLLFELNISGVCCYSEKLTSTVPLGAIDGLEGWTEPNFPDTPSHPKSGPDAGQYEQVSVRWHPFHSCAVSSM